MDFNFLEFIKSLFSDKKCIGCNKNGFFICPDCLKKTDEYSEICYVCKKFSPHFTLHQLCKQKGNIHFLDKIIILTHYSSKNISNLIKKAKYYSETDILSDFGIYLGKKLFQYEEIDKVSDYILLAPPMFYFRKWKRSYNHSELLVKYVADVTHIPFSFKVLKKIKFTPQQSKLPKNKRLLNNKNSFSLKKNAKKIIEGKSVILVDDVISTGATLDKLAYLLKKAGAIKVIGLTIASD